MENYQSPLTRVVKDSRVNEILIRIQRAVKNAVPLVIPATDIKYMSRKFQEGLIQGEKRLYNLSRLILNSLAGEVEIKIDLWVWARCTNPFHREIIKKRFSLDQGFSRLVEKSKTEFTAKFVPDCPDCGKSSPIIASFVQFFPMESSARDTVNFISTRIKTTANLSYKIADMVFGIDRMFKQDKIYGKFTQAIVDVYGIKIITSTKEDIFTVKEWFERHKKVKVLETKDYIEDKKKKSGFQAYKLIIEYHGQVFEVQCQTRRMYNEELYSSEASHQTYKEKQMAQRRKLGHEYVVLYEALKKIFQAPQEISDMDYVELGFGRRRY
jgi:ppGpp synthetase/RelA/SpoT-type nucleotidyltranferase